MHHVCSGRRLCIVQGRAQALALGDLVRAIIGADQLTLEEIPELFWCCSALMIILTGCHPMYFISAMLGVKKNEDSVLYTVEAGNHPMIDPTDESKYLTASQSSYTADVGRVITMRASLINGKPIEALDIRWSTSDTGIVKILGTGGPEVGVQTLAAGTAAVIAQHAQSKNTLTFTVLVAGAGQIHLLPGKTAYLGSVGETMSVSATLYGVRSPVELLGITWSSADPTIAQLVGSTGNSIQVIAKKVGTTTITPSHPRAQNSPPITIHVSAAKARRQDVKYLAARTNAMELQIDARENLRVRLIGGNALDEQGITWGVDDSTRLQMIGTRGNTVIVKGLQAGTVTVTASHPQSVNSLSITINVRDAVRRLSLSSSTMQLKNRGSAKALTLTIRGGFDTDYENLSWSSSDTNVATVFGTSRTVNIQPGSVPGNATITAELTLTGQKVTTLVEVLPDMYIRLPRNMRVEEGKNEEFTFEFATGGNPITFFSTDNRITVVQGRDANKNKITVTAGRKLDGDFSITARSAAGVQDTSSVNVWVRRSLDITDADRATIKIEPNGEPVRRHIAVVPPWEAVGALKGTLRAGKIEFYIESGNNDLVKVTPDAQSQAFSVTTTKEGIDAVMIRDTRTDPPTEYRIPIESEYEDLSSVITASGTSESSGYRSWKVTHDSGAGNAQSWNGKEGRVTINIPNTVNVKSFVLPGNFSCSENQSSGIGATVSVTVNSKTRTLDYNLRTKQRHYYPFNWYVMTNRTAHCGTYIIINHGAYGNKEYRKRIDFIAYGWF